MALQALHQAIAEHPDPQAKQTLSTCLVQMLKVQQNDMAQQQGQGGGPQQALMQQLGGQ